MRAGEDVDRRLLESVDKRRVVAGMQRVVRETPTGQRPRVAVHDADARVTNRGDAMHRQRSEAGPQARTQCVGRAHRSTQLLQDLVRALDVRIRHALRVGAAAAVGVVVVRRLGFNVAAQRDVLCHRPIDRNT